MLPPFVLIVLAPTQVPVAVRVISGGGSHYNRWGCADRWRRDDRSRLRANRGGRDHRRGLRARLRRSVSCLRRSVSWRYRSINRCRGISRRRSINSCRGRLVDNRRAARRRNAKVNVERDPCLRGGRSPEQNNRENQHLFHHKGETPAARQPSPAKVSFSTFSLE